MQGVVIVGAGGMGREAAAWATDAARRDGDQRLPVGFVADEDHPAGQVIGGLPLLGPIGWLETHSGYEALIAIGSPAARADLDTRLTRRGLQLATLVHPTAVVGPGVTIGVGAIIGPNVVLTRDISIGRCVIVNYGALVGHDGLIEDYAFVGPGTAVGGEVTVGTGAWIGIGATLIEGTHVGHDAVVGAGCVVIRDVPTGIKVVGVPARTVS